MASSSLAKQARTFVDFFVPGVPVQEGNISFGKGHSYHREGDRLQAWRNAIAEAALIASRRPVVSGATFVLWAGPVELDLYFTYKVRTKRDRGQPKITRPDLSKLTRAVEDALTGILWQDDAQIAQLDVFKGYVEEDEEPGLSVNAALLEWHR